MFNHKSSPLSASCEGILLGLVLGVLLLSGFVAHVSADTYSTTSWTEGVWYSNLGSTVTYINFNFDNLGVPAALSNGSGYTFGGVLSASTNGYLMQIAMYKSSSGVAALETEVWIGSLTVFTDQYTLSSSDLDSWNNEEVDIASLQQVCEGHYCYYEEVLDWIFDGTTYTTYTTGAVANGDFDTGIVPSVVVESYDLTSSDFNSLDIHGYLQPDGSDVSDLYLYPGSWGYLSDSCSLPSGAQSTSTYIGSGQEAVSNVGVTGHYWTSGSYGATDEFGIGDYSNTYSPINDQSLSSNCSPLPQMA
jgi:hypothetical protein